MSAARLAIAEMVPETYLESENMLYANWPIAIAITKFKSICKFSKRSAFMISTPSSWIYYNKWHRRIFAFNNYFISLEKHLETKVHIRGYL